MHINMSIKSKEIWWPALAQKKNRNLSGSIHLIFLDIQPLRHGDLHDIHCTYIFALWLIPCLCLLFMFMKRYSANLLDNFLGLTIKTRWFCQIILEGDSPTASSKFFFFYHLTFYSKSSIIEMTWSKKSSLIIKIPIICLLLLQK